MQEFVDLRSLAAMEHRQSHESEHVRECFQSLHMPWTVDTLPMHLMLLVDFGRLQKRFRDSGRILKLFVHLESLQRVVVSFVENPLPERLWAKGPGYPATGLRYLKPGLREIVGLANPGQS